MINTIVMKSKVSVFDFMTTAQQKAVSDGLGEIDVTAPLMAAASTGLDLQWEPGVYKISRTIYFARTSEVAK
jgi:hypothetical protein